jgi:hypothetical protein
MMDDGEPLAAAGERLDQAIGDPFVEPSDRMGERHDREYSPAMFDGPGHRTRSRLKLER